MVCVYIDTQNSDIYIVMSTPENRELRKDSKTSCGIYLQWIMTRPYKGINYRSMLPRQWAPKTLCEVIEATSQKPYILYGSIYTKVSQMRINQ